MSITIIADDRETNGANPFFDKYIIADNAVWGNKPKKNGGGSIKLCVNRVTTGDYNIILNDVVPNGTADGKVKQVVSMIIERKTWKDLAASFKDGRTQTQHKEMVSVQERTGCIIMYLIEGRISYDKTTKVGRIPFANLDAKRRHLLLRGHALIQTKDQDHSAEMIVNLARDVWRMYNSGELSFSSQSEVASAKAITYDNYLRELDILNKKYSSVIELPSVDVKSELIRLTGADGFIIHEPIDMDSIAGAADEISDEIDDIELASNLALLDVHSDSTIIPAILTERKIKSDSDIIERMWTAIPGVSVKSAPTLMENYKLSDLITANDVQRRNYMAEIAELKHASGRRLGDDMAKKVMVIGYAGSGVTILDNLRNVSANILAEIPGVTKDTAKAILSKYSLRDICTGKACEDEIAEIKKTANKKIGAKVAGKIIEILLQC